MELTYPSGSQRPNRFEVTWKVNGESQTKKFENEAGALSGHWIPGGYTSGGIREAVIPGQLKIDDVIVKTPGELFDGI